ncbi:MAG: hypothetical protein MJ252_01955, partial [archaeon]|nr:hypothetical protein [archaeon]
MYYDRRPETATKSPEKKIQIPTDDPSSVSLRKCTTLSVPSTSSKRKSKSKQKYRKTPSDARQNIIKTIMLTTNVKENYAKEEYESLLKQKEEIIAMYENIIMKMEEDGRLREEEFRLQTNNMNNKLAELKKRKKNMDLLNYNITKDFLDVKYDTAINNKKLHEENDLIKLQGQALESSLKDVIKKMNIEREVTKNEYARKTKEVTNSLRKQVRKKEDAANLVKEQYKQIQKIYADKVNELETQLSNLMNKYRVLEAQQGIKVEDYMDEIVRLRKALKGQEKYINDLRKMTHGFEDNYQAIYDKMCESSEGFFKEGSQIDNDLSDLGDKLQNELREYKKMIKKANNPQEVKEEDDYEQTYNQNQMNPPQYEENPNEINNYENNYMGNTGMENTGMANTGMANTGMGISNSDDQQMGNTNLSEQGNYQGEEGEEGNYYPGQQEDGYEEGDNNENEGEE